jgi:hypothetical protein
MLVSQPFNVVGVGKLAIASAGVKDSRRWFNHVGLDIRYIILICNFNFNFNIEITRKMPITDIRPRISSLLVARQTCQMPPNWRFAGLLKTFVAFTASPKCGSSECCNYDSNFKINHYFLNQRTVKHACQSITVGRAFANHEWRQSRIEAKCTAHGSPALPSFRMIHTWHFFTPVVTTSSFQADTDNWALSTLLRCNWFFYSVIGAISGNYIYCRLL